MKKIAQIEADAISDARVLIGSEPFAPDFYGAEIAVNSAIMEIETAYPRVYRGRLLRLLDKIRRLREQFEIHGLKTHPRS